MNASNNLQHYSSNTKKLHLIETTKTEEMMMNTHTSPPLLVYTHYRNEGHNLEGIHTLFTYICTPLLIRVEPSGDGMDTHTCETCVCVYIREKNMGRILLQIRTPKI